MFPGPQDEATAPCLVIAAFPERSNGFLRTRHWWSEIGKEVVYPSVLRHVVGSVWIFVCLSDSQSMSS